MTTKIIQMTGPSRPRGGEWAQETAAGAARLQVKTWGTVIVLLSRGAVGGCGGVPPSCCLVTGGGGVPPSCCLVAGVCARVWGVRSLCVFHSGHAGVHPHQQCTEFPVSSLPASLVSVSLYCFLTTAILKMGNGVSV